MVLSADEKEQVYAAQFMPTRPGIVSVSLPPEAAHALEFDQAYHWYLSVHCQGDPNALTANVLTVDGWVQRISPMSDIVSEQTVLAPTTELATNPTLAEPSLQPADLSLPTLWYDAIADVANALALNPQPDVQLNPQLDAQLTAQKQVQWTHWLTVIGLGAIAEQPVVGPVLLQQADTFSSNNPRATLPATY